MLDQTISDQLDEDFNTSTPTRPKGFSKFEIEDEIENINLPSKLKVLGGLVTLAPEISRTNYYCMILNSILRGYLIYQTDQLQAFLFINPDGYNMSSSNAAKAYTFTTIFDFIIQTILTPWYASRIDKYGRQIMLRIGYIIAGLSYFLLPIVNWGGIFTNFFPFYFMMRFFYLNAEAILPCLPLGADYLDESTLGRALAINATGTVGGALLATIIFEFVHTHINVDYMYYIYGGFIAVLGYLLSFGIKGGAYYYRKKAKINAGDQASAKSVLTILFESLRNQPWIIVSYLIAPMVGYYASVSSQTLIYFVDFYYPDNNLEAQTISSLDIMIAQIVNVSICLFFGLAIDRFKTIKVVLFICFCGLFGFLMTLGIWDPDNLYAFITMGIIGLSSAGSLISCDYVGFKYFPSNIRGLLSGFTVIFFESGAIFASLSAYLMSATKFLPFIVACVLFSLIIIAIMLLYFLKLRHLEGKEQSEDKK